MNQLLSKITLPVLIGATSLALTACKTATPDMGGTETDNVVAVNGGVAEVDTITISATVVSIDTKNQKVTLQSDDTGAKETFTVPPNTVDLSELSVGDDVQAEVTEAVAVYIGDGDPPSSSSDGGIMLSTDGNDSSGAITETSQVTATVAAIDTKNRKVTFKLPDGTSKTVKVSKDIDLSDVTVGESLTIVTGESLAVSIIGE